MTGGTKNLTTFAQDIFLSSIVGGGDGQPCQGFTLTNVDATNTAFITVSGLHDNGAYPLVPGEVREFKADNMGNGGITHITGLTATGTALVRGGVTSRV